MPSDESPKITHVIFDMDGLLLDTETQYEKAIGNVVGAYGHEYPFELKRKIMGRKATEGIQIIVDTLQLPITYEQYSELVDAEYRKVFSQYIPLMPGAERLVRHLSAKGVPIAVATSSKGFTFNLKTKPHQELFSLFHHILIASEDPEIVAGKPHPQTFLVAAARFDEGNRPTDMSRVLVFEDSVAGVQAANAAGMRSVWVPDPRMPRDAVVAYQTLDSLEQFKPEEYGLPAYD
ncbi:Pseudouridine-5'-phosphatase [Tyrophagus putrescentiae]|nr:Pseudouridine-5'-phosphatase [Tyrophagus putrescentiae]